MIFNSSLKFNTAGPANQEPQVVDNKRNDSAITVQTVVRGYLARRSLGKNKLDNQVSFMQKKADDILSKIIKVAETIESRWHGAQISQQDQNYAVLQLAYIKSCLAVHTHDLKSAKEQSFRTKKDEFDCVDALHHSHFANQNGLKEAFEKVGSMSLKKGLITVLGCGQYYGIKEETREKLEDFNKVFNPTKCCSFIQIGIERGGLIQFANKDGEVTSYPAADFNEGKVLLSYITRLKEISIMDHIHGVELAIPFIDIVDQKSLIIIKGFFKPNPLCYQSVVSFLSPKYFLMMTKLKQLVDIPESFRKIYLNLYPARDLYLKSEENIIEDLKADYKLQKLLLSTSISDLYTQFIKLPMTQQARILTLLLMEEEPIYAITIYNSIANNVPDFARLIRCSLHNSVQRKLEIDIDTLEKSIQKLSKMSIQNQSYETRIAISKMDLQSKARAMEQLQVANSSTGQDAAKAKLWLDGLLSVPFGVYKSETVNRFSPVDSIKLHLSDLKKNLNLTVFGQHKAKKAILEWIGQRIQNGTSKGDCLAFVGPPGTGKTTFALGIAKALSKSLVFIKLAGCKDSSDLLGHNSTYVASKKGLIVDGLIQAGSMDPVMYFDEPDKVIGDEIFPVLTILADFEQNDKQQDRYFSGINFDMSHALYIFSLNELDKIPPVLRERMKVIEYDPLSIEEKIPITAQFLLPSILKTCGYEKGQLYIEDEDLRFLVENYTFEGGARELKRKLMSVVCQINLQLLEEPGSIQLPFKIDQASIVKYLDRPQNEFKKIASKPHIGTVNGMYATATGVGGLTIVQVMLTLSKERLGLQLTGSQGKVMQESMTVARTVAWNLIPKKIKERIQKKSPEGLHIHCPEGATPKDGPSAGAAITTAIVSRLMKIPIRNDISMTGEIDGNGRVTKIGGLDAKLHGAKKAGVRLALVPRENEKDIHDLIQKYPRLFDDTFEFKFMDDIYDALENALVYCPLKRGEIESDDDVMTL